MKKSRLQFVALIVFVSILLASCAVAPATPAAAPAEGESGAAAGAVPITIFSPQGTDVNLETNSFTKEAEEKFGIDFTWQTTTYDGNSAKEQRQISLASGDYPDLYMLIPWVDQFTQLELLKYGQQGVVIPLNDLIAEHGPNIQAALDNYPLFRAMTVAPDGNIYGLPQLIECYHCSYANKMWVNTKWREALGIEVPATTEEFQAMLEAFKTQDPNGNGQADEVPLSGSIEDFGVRPLSYLINGFAYSDDRTYLILNDGKVDTVANKPEWKEGLAYIKGLYDAGLIDPGAFTQNAEAFKKIGDNAEAQLLGAGAGMHPAIFVSVGPEAPYGADYDAIPPLKGPHAQYATYLPNTVPGATFVLTNKASPEAQIAAIKLVDSMFTEEGQLRAHFGEEGVDWRRPQEGDVALNKEVAPIVAVIEQPADSEPRNSSWGAMAQYFQPKSFRDGWVQSIDPEEYYLWPGYERRLQDATDLMAGKESPDHFPFWSLWPDPATADAVAMQRQNITDYVNQNALQFITGVKSLDADWDSYVAGLEQLDLAGYLAAMQTAYDASQAK